jgi:hypothetical protein
MPHALRIPIQPSQVSASRTPRARARRAEQQTAAVSEIYGKLMLALCMCESTGVREPSRPHRRRTAAALLELKWTATGPARAVSVHPWLLAVDDGLLLVAQKVRRRCQGAANSAPFSGAEKCTTGGAG